MSYITRLKRFLKLEGENPVEDSINKLVRSLNHNNARNTRDAAIAIIETGRSGRIGTILCLKEWLFRYWNNFVFFFNIRTIEAL